MAVADAVIIALLTATTLYQHVFVKATLSVISFGTGWTTLLVMKMPIGDLAEDNAHCWLWVSNATLRVGFEILEKWGFTPRSVFTWVKPRMGLFGGSTLHHASSFWLGRAAFSL